MSVKMDVKALIVDPIANVPVVILRDADEKNFLPIWVGVFEANAIALQMEGVTTPAPDDARPPARTSSARSRAT